MSYKFIIEEILWWAESQPDFNTDFVESVQKGLREFGSLTWSQEQALDNIYEGFNIAEWAKLKEAPFDGTIEETQG